MMKEEMNSESNNNATMGLLGEYLKQKRIDKNYSLEKLSQKTKISLNILKCIEVNDYEHLPSAAYIKGFVTSYVKVLGLPLDEAINKMEYTYLNVLGKPFPALNHTKLMSSTTTPVVRPIVEAEEEPSPHDLIENSDSIMKNTKSALPIFVLVAVVLVFIGGYKLISSVVEDEVSDQKSQNLGPKIESSSALVKQPVKPAETPKEGQKLDSAATSSATEALKDDKKEEAKPTPEFERNFPSMDFKKVSGKLFAIKSDAPENEDEDFLPETIKNASNPDLQNIYIKAFDGNTWLSYKIDTNPIESVIISKGSDLFIQGSEIRIFLGNVNVTKIFYNSHLIDTPTKNGVKSLIFPEESNSKFLLPLFPKAKDDILYTSDEYMKRMKLEEDELEKRKTH